MGLLNSQNLFLGDTKKSLITHEPHTAVSSQRIIMCITWCRKYSPACHISISIRKQHNIQLFEGIICWRSAAETKQLWDKCQNERKVKTCSNSVRYRFHGSLFSTFSQKKQKPYSLGSFRKPKVHFLSIETETVVKISGV